VDTSEYLELGTLCENPVPVYALAADSAPAHNIKITSKENTCFLAISIVFPPIILLL
jgi:hypothetical protein